LNTLRTCLSKIMLNYTPNGRRGIGRAVLRLLDESETGLSRPKSWRMVMMMLLLMMMIMVHGVKLQEESFGGIVTQCVWDNSASTFCAQRKTQVPEIKSPKGPLLVSRIPQAQPFSTHKRLQWKIALRILELSEIFYDSHT